MTYSKLSKIKKNITETIHQITIGDLVIDVIRKDIKNMHLSVHPPTGRIRITAPLIIDDKLYECLPLPKWDGSKQTKSN